MTTHDKGPAGKVTAKVQELRSAMSDLGQADDFNAFLWWWNNHPGRTSVAHLEQLESMMQPVLEQALALNRVKQEALQKNQQLIRQVQSNAA